MRGGQQQGAEAIGVFIGGLLKLAFYVSGTVYFFGAIFGAGW